MLSMMDYECEDDLAAVYHAKRDGLAKMVEKMSPDQLAMLMLDIMLMHGLEVDGYDIDADREHLDAAASLYGVDVDQVRAEISGGTPTPVSAARAPKGAAAGATAKKATKAKRVGKAFHPTHGPRPNEPELALEDQSDDAGVAGGRTLATEEA